MKPLSALRVWYQRYETHIGTAVFFAGFFWDYFTLTRIDRLSDTVILGIYLVVAGISIALVNAAESLKEGPSAFAHVAEYFPLALQFAFGGLFSGFFIFYSRSASLSASWPFLLGLGALLVGNEFFRARYTRFVFQTSILFVALTSYAIYVVPIITKAMGPRIFLVSTLCALTVAVLFIVILRLIAPDRFKVHRWGLWASIAFITLSFNILYFTRILPPIPLSLKEFGIYHGVVRVPEGYRVTYEKLPGLAFFGDYDRTFHRAGSEPAYAYSAIFAPTQLRAKIFHRWLYFDPEKNEWTETDMLSFPITGGRDGGWRGFTFKRNITPGLWRVEVVTERGERLGRATFTVASASTSAPLYTTVR